MTRSPHIYRKYILYYTIPAIVETVCRIQLDDLKRKTMILQTCRSLLVDFTLLWLHYEFSRISMTHAKFQRVITIIFVICVP